MEVARAPGRPKPGDVPSGDRPTYASVEGPSVDLERRFGGLRRLYGHEGYERLRASRVAVVGLGGVGSWTVEALARRLVRMPETPDAPRGGVPEFRGAGRSLEVLRAEAHDELAALIELRCRNGEDPWDVIPGLPTVDEQVVISIRAAARGVDGVPVAGVIVASEPFDDSDGWVDVPPDHLLVATAAAVEIVPLPTLTEVS